MHKPDNFEQKNKSLLDESLDDISPEIMRRLQQARYAALEKAKPRTIWSYYPRAIAATLVVSVISASLFINFDDNVLNNSEVAMEADIEMLTSSEGLELMEDLEFMQWLAESDEYAS
ncbi:MAG: DUF3619 family protein [Gammaproteobacteria bacterium]|nr:DUF3619 family protein [Gammaproteobacteria bacterium]